MDGLISFWETIDNYIFYDFFIQFLGILAFILGIVSFLQKNDFRLKIVIGLSSLVLSSHLYLLGAQFGALCAVISSLRQFASIHPRASKLFPIFLIFYGYLIVLNIGSGFIDFLPVISGIIGTYAMLFLTGVNMRYGFLIGQILWFVHNVYYFSIGGVLMELSNGAANIKTIFDLRRSHKND